MRSILSHYLNCAAAKIDYQYNQYGKPYLPAANPETYKLYFNLAHSHDYALFALNRSAEVGVDLEFDSKNRQRDIMRLAKRFYHPDEYRGLESLEPEQRSEAFYRIWTRKEAFTKAIGSGIQFSFRQFEVSIGETPELLWIDNHKFDAPVSLINIPIEKPYTACLAVLSASYQVDYIDWPNE